MLRTGEFMLPPQEKNNNAELQIGGDFIGTNHAPYIIAEMSGNHNQSLDRALEIVSAAAQAGAHAIKLQTYTADTMTLDVKSDVFLIDDDESLWSGKYLYDLYKTAHTPWEWHEPIIEKAHEVGITCFSSPFDESAVDFLESLNVPAYKIASFENTHLPLIRKVAETGKPMIISTGLASFSEIEEAVSTARTAGCKDLILLKCTSSYPATPDSSNILTIPHMKDAFNCPVGLSDHTLGIGTSLAAIAHGACLIEKHFTLSREEGGVDSAFSLVPTELEQLVQESKSAFQALGHVNFGPTDNEVNSLCFRRSLFFVKELKKNDVITEADIRIIRPGQGLPPKFYHEVIGREVNQNIEAGTPVSWKHLL